MTGPVVSPAAGASANGRGEAAGTDGRPGAGGPGEIFARAVAEAPADGDLTVDLPMSLPLTFPFFANRPRYTVRHLLPAALAAPAGPDGVPYLHEPPSGHSPARGGTSYDSSPESSFSAALQHLRLTDVTVTVPVPAGLLALPGLLAGFVERRVVVRLCTVENQALLRGSADGCLPGLLGLPALRRKRGSGDLVSDLARAAALVEETGGSCDGMVVHPEVYWALVASGALGRFNAAGVRVARTRMIDRSSALLGDFRAAATLIDPASSRLRLHRDPGDGPDTIEAANRIGLAVHLPQHLLLLGLL